MAKAQRRGTDKAMATPSVESTTLAGDRSADVSERDIARRAFELYCERAGEDRHDLDDWFQAERELRGAATSTAA
jgi:hypothetical protein